MVLPQFCVSLWLNSDDNTADVLIITLIKDAADLHATAYHMLQSISTPGSSKGYEFPGEGCFMSALHESTRHDPSDLEGTSMTMTTNYRSADSW
jgi:hypothetical protein